MNCENTSLTLNLFFCLMQVRDLRSGIEIVIATPVSPIHRFLVDNVLNDFLTSSYHLVGAAH